MNEQDWRAVETMVLSGLDLEGLYAVFHGFAKEAIDRIIPMPVFVILPHVVKNTGKVG